MVEPGVAGDRHHAVLLNGDALDSEASQDRIVDRRRAQKKLSVEKLATEKLALAKLAVMWNGRPRSAIASSFLASSTALHMRMGRLLLESGSSPSHLPPLGNGIVVAKSSACLNGQPVFSLMHANAGVSMLCYLLCRRNAITPSSHLRWLILHGNL